MNDYDILEYLRSTYTPLKKLYVYKNKKGKSETYTFITTDEYDIKFLRIVGVGERKSKYIRLPKINDRYMRDMIRGIFDGDGSVYMACCKASILIHILSKFQLKPSLAII